jgi:hypothetical protein
MRGGAPAPQYPAWPGARGAASPFVCEWGEENRLGLLWVALRCAEQQLSGCASLSVTPSYKAMVSTQATLF